MEESLTKICTCCGEEKPLDLFTYDKRSSDGRVSRCKECKKLDNKKSHEKNGRVLTPEQKKEKSKRDVEYKRKRRREDGLYRISDNLSRMLRKKLKNLGAKKDIRGNWLGCSNEDFKQHIESQFQKGMSWENYGEWHLDHNIPLAAAKTIEEVYKFSNYLNIVPLWANDNLSKNGFYIEEDKQRFLDSLK